MWNVLPKLGLAKGLMLLICILVTSSVIWVTSGFAGVVKFYNEDGLGTIIAVSFPVLITFIILTWLMGTYIWRAIWKIPYLGSMLLNQKICPDLNGTWTGEVISSFKDEDGNSITKQVTLTIKASFLNFDISLVSDDKYQRSTVVQSEIYKDQRNGSFYLSYIFESVVDQPMESDDSKFDGSAKLNIRFDENKITLVGVYWTNRCWQKGMQTAGTMILNKKTP